MDFREIGLSDNEEKAYRALIQHVRLTASGVSRASGVSYGKIYEILASLEHKGFAKVIPEKTKVYVPTNPEQLISIIERKQQSLDALKKEAAQMKSMYEETDREPVQVVRGVHNFHKILRRLDEPRTINYSIKYNVDTSPEILRRNKEFLDRGVHVKALARVAPETKENLKKWITIHPQKAFDNAGIAMGLTDTQAMFILLNKNTTFVVNDEAFVQVMKEMFEHTYADSSFIDAKSL